MTFFHSRGASHVTVLSVTKLLTFCHISGASHGTIPAFTLLFAHVSFTPHICGSFNCCLVTVFLSEGTGHVVIQLSVGARLCAVCGIANHRFARALNALLLTALCSYT